MFYWHGNQYKSNKEYRWKPKRFPGAKDGRLKKNGPGPEKVKLIQEDGTPYPQDSILQFSDVTVDPTTGSVILRVVFPNPEDILLPGMNRPIKRSFSCAPFSDGLIGLLHGSETGSFASGRPEGKGHCRQGHGGIFTDKRRHGLRLPAAPGHRTGAGHRI